MKLSDLVRDLPGVRLEGADAEVVDLSHDSREIGPGWLFVALPGRRADGRAFVDAALAAGAAAVALPEGADAPAGLPVVRLERPRPALARLAARIHGEPASRLQMVGVTGTNGKTTVTTLLAAICRAAGRPEGLVGTVVTRVGDTVRPARFTTPEAPELQRLLAEMVRAGVDVAVMEVSSIGLEEHRVDGVPFRAAAFLNLTVDHLDYHASMAAYGAAKRRLFTELLHPDGRAVINVDDDYGRALADDLPPARVWRLSVEGPADVCYEALALDAAGVHGRLRTPVGAVAVESPLPGRFNAANLAAAAALALSVGLPVAAVEAAFAQAGVPGRMQPVPNDRGLAVVVDYAHSPDALARVIEALRPLTTGALWCVFGCGGDRDASKRPEMGRAAALADAVVVTNDNPRGEDPAAIARAALAGAVAAGRPEAGAPSPGHCCVLLDRREAIRSVLRAARRGDTVLLAGKGHETYQEIAGVRRPFDDAAEAAAALAEGEP